MAGLDEKGKLSYDEFEKIKPATYEKNGKKNSRIEFLVSGTVGPNLELEGEYWIVGINIPNRFFTANGIQDNRVALGTLTRIQLTGLESGRVTTLTVKDRILETNYASFEVEPYPISTFAEFRSPDPSNPHWNDTSSIHFEYDCVSNEGSDASINFVPNTVLKAYVDEYDVVLGSVQELRGSNFVMPVKSISYSKPVPLRSGSVFIITGSVADSYFSDSGICSGHFYGSKNVGQYRVKEIPGLVSKSLVARTEELKRIGTQRDPAFMYLTGFSGSIIKDEYTDKDIEAGTANFEELKFSRYRVSESRGDFYEYWYTASISSTGSKMEPIEAFFENIVFERWQAEPVEVERRRPHQKHLQYFELFATGSSEFSSSRSLPEIWPTPPPEGTGPIRYGGGIYNTGSLRLPELCDIIYQPTSGSVYSRVSSKQFYIAESNAMYRTDRFGRVYQIDVLDPTGSVEPTGSSDIPEEEMQ